MANRLVSVGDDFTLPTAVKVANANLPAHVQPAALTATYALKSELTSAGIQVVYHLANASFARPTTTGPVLWVGSVAPLNRIAGDQFFVANPQAVEPPTPWLASFTASSLGLADLSTVTTWEDESANNNDMTQATAGSRPTFHVAAGANPAFVRFAGAHTLASAAFSAAPTQPFTLFAAIRHNTINTASGSFNNVVTGLAASQFTLRARGNGSASVWSAEAGLSGDSTTAITTGQWYVISVIFDGTTSSLGINGVIAAKSMGTNGFTGLRVGSSYTGASSFFNGDLHAVKVVQGRLDNPNRRAVEQSLADAVGVTLA